MRFHTAFLFPGQGSAAVGMGAAMRLAERRRFDHWFAQAEAASGLAIRRAVTAGPLTTAALQPALFALSLALVDSAASGALRPAVVAGHGVGEYAAAVVAGALTPGDAMSLIAARGRLIAAAESRQSGAMALVERIPLSVVEHTCALVREKHGYVTLAHADAPSQSTVAGNASAVAAAVARLRRLGAATRVLAGRGAHNSMLMARVQAQLARLAEAISWHDARIPLVTANGGRLLTSGAAIRSALIAQETSPLQWTRCMDTLLEAGCNRFLELGPGRRLTRLALRHAPRAVAMAADDPVGLALFSAGPPVTRSEAAHDERLAS